MCGIAGCVEIGGKAAASEVVRRMTDALAHRGPDGEGCWCEGPIGLGHRRLAILDLSAAAAQPMVSEDGRQVLTYNGELYNFAELRDELESLGWSFTTRSDTEVVLKSLIQWRTAAVRRFNGMFAFAWWDSGTRELLIARDRYGIKPLYLCHTSQALVFGSEVKAILAHPACSARMDVEGLLEYFTFQNFFTDRTLFENVQLFPPGTFARFSAEGRELERERYWDYDFKEPQHPSDEREYLEEVDRLFIQAIERQLVSDVEVGAYLSGGMDSGSITALAAARHPYIKSFTCGFDLHSASGMELGCDERAQAELMSYVFKTEHYEMVLKAGDMERVLPRLTHHLEEPRVGQSYPNFYVAQLAGKFVKVVLAGTGGDELFGGYPWRYYRAVVNDDFEDYVGKYYDFWQRLIPQPAVAAVFAPLWPQVRHVDTRAIFRSAFRHHSDRLDRPEDFVNHSLNLEARTFLHSLLVVEDKLAMAHGLEVRLPFLDNDLVDFAMRTPVRLKLGGLAEVVRLNENQPGDKTRAYFQKTRDGKLLLRKAMKRYIPHEVADGTKQGFAAPDASWFKGESIEYVRRVVCDPHARIYEFLDRPAVLGLVDEHLTGKQNRRLLIWSLLSVEQWCKRFL